MQVRGLHRIGRCRASCIGDGSWGIVSRMSDLMFTRYGIQRQLSASGHDCVVVAPSLIPKRPGDRIKTDRRDASSLAKLHRAGELTAVWVPDPGHEAMRRARQQLSSFLLRQGCHYRRPAWTKLHRRWLAGLRFEQAVHHIVLEDYIQAVETASWRGLPKRERSPSSAISVAALRV